MDLSDLLIVTDIFVIATGASSRQVKSLVAEVERVLKETMGRRPLRREGVEHGKWVLLDLGDVVVHAFDRETRDYYSLELLWADAPRIEYEPAVAEA